MNLKTFLLFSTLVLSPIALPQKAQANEPKCKLSTDCVYGGRVNDRWVEGANAELKADFDSARVAYTRAFDAAEMLKFPGKSETQVQLLQACATQGSFARLAGAIAGSEYMNTHLITRESSDMALQISRQKFRDTLDAQDLEFPELASKCP